MANMVKDKDGVVKYWVRAHEVTCNYTEYEHDVEYNRYYMLRESREYKKHGKAVRQRITKKEYLAVKKITEKYIALIVSACLSDIRDCANKELIHK